MLGTEDVQNEMIIAEDMVKTLLKLLVNNL